MKLLLTSGGVTNPSIPAALEAMLPRPFAECSALCVLTAQWGHPWCTPNHSMELCTGRRALRPYRPRLEGDRPARADGPARNRAGALDDLGARC